MTMLSESVWLYDRWYGPDSRERVRHLALWAQDPVLLYANCGLPPDSAELVEDEIRLFQREGVLRFWEYSDERRFPESLSSFVTQAPKIITNEEYRKVMAFVDGRLTQSAPNLQELGFQTMEGMLLEQVVLRRRYLAQALCGSLSASTLACEGEPAGRSPLHGEIVDTLEDFFSAMILPSLLLLPTDDFLELRRRSQAILPSIVQELHQRFQAEPRPDTRKDVVEKLVRQYQGELNSLVHDLGSRTAKPLYEALSHGTVTQMQSKMELFMLDEASSRDASWFAQDAEGKCRLALLMLEWRAGTINLSRPRRKR